MRAMTDLAQQDGGSYTSLAEISRRQGISVKYLEIVVKSLVKGGLLEGQRGKGGGYRLTRPAAEITAGEVVELAEGPLATVACLADGAETCPRECECKTLPLWRECDEMVRDYLYGVTLADLIEGRVGKR